MRLGSRVGSTSARVVRTSPAFSTTFARRSARAFSSSSHPHPRSGARFATRPSHGSRLSFTRYYSSSGVLVYEWLLFRVCAETRGGRSTRPPRGAPAQWASKSATNACGCPSYLRTSPSTSFSAIDASKFRMVSAENCESSVPYTASTAAATPRQRANLVVGRGLPVEDAARAHGVGSSGGGSNGRGAAVTESYDGDAFRVDGIHR